MAHVLEEKWRSVDVQAKENVDFSALLLSDRVLKGLKNAGFIKPSPIQLEAIPYGRFGYDTLVQAKSGTGKTLVFAVTALEMLKPKLFRPQVLVLAPTREIATQICSVFKQIGSTFPKLTCAHFIGGLPLFEDKEKAVMSQIVVGTPGRLRQLVDIKALPTNSIRLLVFDEADELLYGTSFKDDIETIFQSLPEGKQVMATSATFGPGIRKTLKRYLKDNPQYVRLNVSDLALIGMVHYAAVVPFCPMPALQYKYKFTMLLNILKGVKFVQCLIFCCGIQRVEVIHKDLQDNGVSCSYISSAKEQLDRLKAIQQLKRFKCKVLVTSDLTSRGIDAENVDLVINFDLSNKIETHMHRIGRAGRYGTFGIAVSIVQENELQLLKRLEKEGAFVTYRLPDPIPKDIILNPTEDNFDMDEYNPEFEDGSQLPEHTKFIYGKCELLNGSDHHSEEDVGVENGEIKDVLKKSHNGTIKLAVKSDSKIEKVDEGSSVHSDSESVTSDKEINDKRLQNGNIDNSINLYENKDSDLMNNCDQNKPINSDSIDKILVSDVYRNCNDKEAFEKEDIMNDNIKNDSQLNNRFSNDSENPKTNDFETVDEKSNELQTGNLHKPLEIEDNIENSGNDKKIDEIQVGDIHVSDKFKDMLGDDSMNCEPESVNKSGNTLSTVIKTFIDTYELDNKGKSSTSDTVLDSQSSEKSDKKNITIDMIKALNSQKREFFYKTFKKFCKDKKIVSCFPENKKEDNMKEIQKDFKETVSGLSKSKKEDNIEEIKKDFHLSPANENKSNTDSVQHEKLVESLEFKNSKVVLEKPNFESTPQLSAKNKQENAKIITNSVFKPMFYDKLVDVSAVLSDLDSSEDDETNSNQSFKLYASETLSSESASDSSESDSSDEADSETDSSVCSESESSSSTNSSSNEVNKGSYHHNFRTGRQNPSLISDVSRNQMYHDQISRRNVPNHNFSSIQHKPFQNAVRYEMPRKTHRGCRHRIVDQHFFISEGTRNFRRGYDDSFVASNSRGNLLSSEKVFHSADREEPNLTNHSASKFSFSRNDSKHHRSKNSSRNITSEENQNTRKDKPGQRCSKHHHSTRCFMPTEHRCHPNTPEYPCTQGPICDLWYKTFYNQWLYIQNVIH